MPMMRVMVSTSVMVVLTGLAFGLVGAATATDLVSLRNVAHSLDVPMLSGLVFSLREAMPTTVAHTLEPATAAVGGLVAAFAMLRPAQRLALGFLRAG
jgi:hypothetical protein